jgi:hypothetical protein
MPPHPENKEMVLTRLLPTTCLSLPQTPAPERTYSSVTHFKGQRNRQEEAVDKGSEDSWPVERTGKL